MIISFLECEVKVRVIVDIDFVFIFFEKWGKFGYFSWFLVRGLKIIIWIWNFYVDVYDFDSYIFDLEDVLCKIFSVYFGYLVIIFVWLSGVYFYGVKFFNYEVWLVDFIGIKLSV